MNSMSDSPSVKIAFISSVLNSFVTSVISYLSPLSKNRICTSRLSDVLHKIGYESAVFPIFGSSYSMVYLIGFPFASWNLILSGYFFASHYFSVFMSFVIRRDMRSGNGNSFPGFHCMIMFWNLLNVWRYL